MMNKEKLCCICKQIKSTSEFYKSKQSKDGFDFHCKQCDKEKKLKVELQCSCCDNKFKGTYKQQKAEYCFCSRKCFSMSSRFKLRENGYRSEKVTIKRCVVCEYVGEPHMFHGSYCNKCYREKRKKHETTCSNCNKTFNITSSQLKRNTKNNFCSRNCKEVFERGDNHWHKNIPISNEQKEFLKITRIGENNPFYGKKHSKETIAHLSVINSGELNASWKGGISPLMRYLRNCKEYSEWRSKIFERSNGMCEITGEKCELQVHHIYSFMNVVYDVLDELNLDVRENIGKYTTEELQSIRDEVFKRHTLDVGIAISKMYHEKFHTIYGRGNNTKQQLDDFVRNVNHDNTELTKETKESLAM